MNVIEAARDILDTDLTEVSDFALSCPFCGGEMKRGTRPDERWHQGFAHYPECSWLVLPQIVAALEALAWYAEVGAESSVELLDDHGKRARAALHGQEPAADATRVYEQQPADAVSEARKGGSYTTCKQCRWQTNGWNGAKNHAPSCVRCECWEWPSGLFDDPVNGHHKDCPKVAADAE